MEILTPCKIESLEQIDTQFVTIDYVPEMNVCSKFGKNPFTGDFWAKGRNITFCVTLFFFFLDQRREETPGPLFTPPNPQNLALNRQFPAKMMKRETPSISVSIY